MANPATSEPPLRSVKLRFYTADRTVRAPCISCSSNERGQVTRSFDPDFDRLMQAAVEYPDALAETLRLAGLNSVEVELFTAALQGRQAHLNLLATIQTILNVGGNRIGLPVSTVSRSSRAIVGHGADPLQESQDSVRERLRDWWHGVEWRSVGGLKTLEVHIPLYVLAVAPGEADSIKLSGKWSTRSSIKGGVTIELSTVGFETRKSTKVERSQGAKLEASARYAEQVSFRASVILERVRLHINGQPKEPRGYAVAEIVTDSPPIVAVSEIDQAALKPNSDRAAVWDTPKQRNLSVDAEDKVEHTSNFALKLPLASYGSVGLELEVSQGWSTQIEAVLPPKKRWVLSRLVDRPGVLLRHETVR